MKKIAILVCAMVLGISACIAVESESMMAENVSVESLATKVNVPTGVFFNGSDFIKVESSWVRIVVNRNMNEYSFTAEMDPHGNYLLNLGQGKCITIYPNGRSLYYNGATYTKK